MLPPFPGTFRVFLRGLRWGEGRNWPFGISFLRHQRGATPRRQKAFQTPAETENTYFCLPHALDSGDSCAGASRKPGSPVPRPRLWAAPRSKEAPTCPGLPAHRGVRALGQPGFETGGERQTAPQPGRGRLGRGPFGGDMKGECGGGWGGAGTRQTAPTDDLTSGGRRCPGNSRPGDHLDQEAERGASRMPCHSKTPREPKPGGWRSEAGGGGYIPGGAPPLASRDSAL